MRPQVPKAEMLFKLTEAQEAMRSALIEKAAAARADVNLSIRQFNEIMRQQTAIIESQVQTFDETLYELENFAEVCADLWILEYEMQSEAWQRAHRAEAGLISEWDNIMVVPIGMIILPDELDEVKETWIERCFKNLKSGVE